MHAIDPAATVWLLASTALVPLMTPGLAISTEAGVHGHLPLRRPGSDER
jgi:ammonia channel protein AmtB